MERQFAELLCDHRGAAGLTQEELAARAGLSVSAISLLERGERTAPRACTIARLAEALELDAVQRREFAAAVRRRRPAVGIVVLPGRRLPGRRLAAGSGA